MTAIRDDRTVKRCSTCGLVKTADAFGYRAKNGRLRSACRSCDNADTRAWYRKNPEKAKANNDRAGMNRAGLSPSEYDLLFTKQAGRCAICNKPPRRRRLAIDHDHLTGRTRSLLCDHCNMGLGHFLDDPALLRAAAEYLGFHFGHPPNREAIETRAR